MQVRFVLKQPIGTVAQENSRQYFKEGEILPEIKSDWGEVYWQFDGEE